ncbi:PilN domain-containing protein [Kangiella sediminilitoris]|uniref:Fimbrial assembly family protein n=1 Tax=Kangiella sediminilitoris TaxID=1144748 RepID=A0A1B3B8I4_9GAMM|nr:PilN domain-containing protein [Kangiella sediminilitoris]AOE49090.1 Fimbrial assembly family protein [Kangiella sediminilitoris]
MARINLLDWRGELRQERNKEFWITFGLMLVLAALIFVLVHFVMQSRIDNQDQRINKLNTEIGILKQQTKEIEKLKKEKEELIKRMNLITDLQRSRPEVVRMFDELTRVTPEGINLTTWQRVETSVGNKNERILQHKLVFTGQGETNPRISEFMRKMDSSERLQTSSLKDVNKQTKGLPAQNFTLEAKQVVPGKETVEEGK